LRNPYKRLGAYKGAAEIKSHPFFTDIDWEDVLLKRIAQPKIKVKQLKDKKSKIIMEGLLDTPKKPQSKFKDERLYVVDNWEFLCAPSERE
jgi:hypothetical protein